LRQLRARINKLQYWLKEEVENITSPTLADAISDILSRREQTGKSSYYPTINNLKVASQMLSFLQENQIMDMAGLQEKLKSMYSKNDILMMKMKPLERRLRELPEHIKQAGYYQEFRDIYREYKQLKRPKKQEAFRDSCHREITLYEAADRYLRQHLNGRNEIPVKSWKEELERLIAE
jgi:transcriptional accessory protein Tex/SPT6